MVVMWKVIVTIFLLSVIVTDANRARRRRRQTVLNSGQSVNPNPQTDARQLPLNAQGLQQQQPLQQQMGQGGLGMQKDMNAGQNQGGRQYSPYPNQYGMGAQGSNYYPYGGMGGSQYGGMGGSQYGMGQYGQYGSSYNQNPYSGGYQGYNQGYNQGSYYNRPGYSNSYGSGYNSQYGGGGGGYYWGAGHKQNGNLFTVFFSSIVALTFCLITV